MKTILLEYKHLEKVAKIIEAEGWQMKEQPLEWQLLERMNGMEVQVKELTRRFVGLENRLHERGIV